MHVLGSSFISWLRRRNSARKASWSSSKASGSSMIFDKIALRQFRLARPPATREPNPVNRLCSRRTHGLLLNSRDLPKIINPAGLTTNSKRKSSHALDQHIVDAPLRRGNLQQPPRWRGRLSATPAGRRRASARSCPSILLMSVPRRRSFRAARPSSCMRVMTTPCMPLRKPRSSANSGVSSATSMPEPRVEQGDRSEAAAD